MRRAVWLCALAVGAQVTGVSVVQTAGAQLPPVDVPELPVPDLPVPDVPAPEVPSAPAPQLPPVPSVPQAPAVPEAPAVPSAPAPSRDTASSPAPSGAPALSTAAAPAGSSQSTRAAAPRRSAGTAPGPGPGGRTQRAERAAVERRMRRMVRRLAGCLGGLPSRQRAVLVLRAGIGPRASFSRPRVGRRLDVLLFACAYGVVRAAHIALFVLASRDDPDLRRSTTGSPAAPRSASGCWSRPRSPTARSRAGCGRSRWRSTWTARDGPGRLEADPGPLRRAPRLIVIIALGESIVAIGVGADHGVDAGIVVAACVGTAVAAALWWLYFDIVALVAERRLSKATPGRERGIARDSFSLLHFPMMPASCSSRSR